MSTNLSKIRRDELIRGIKDIRNRILFSESDPNREALLELLTNLETELRGKKYGLVFEEHEEKIDTILKTHIPVLTEVKDLFIDNRGQMNFLIEGDNLAALQILEKTHRGKIDLIYIDPPYNTGNKDFIYDDIYVNKDDSYRHSKWLSFMFKRLILCKKLLSENGFICISIDDNESSQLKMLCDSIFGEENYQKTDYIQVRYPNKTLKEGMSYHKEIEQVLIYGRSNLSKPYLKPSDYTYDKFVYSIKELGNGKATTLGGKKVIIYTRSEYQITKHSEGFKNGLKEVWASGTVLNGTSSGRFFRDYLSERKEKDGLGVLYKVYGIGNDKYDYRYFTGPVRKNATKGKYYQGVPTTKCEEGSKKYNPIPNFYDMAADFGNISHEGKVPFNNGKKPVKLIIKYIQYFEKKDITVLDFFAGSGSTGHAVLKQNNIDGGSRHYILVTNNQNMICKNKTYTRLKNVIQEYGNNTSLKYLRVDYIPISEKFYYEYADTLLAHVRELVELENGINFTENAKIAIILTDEELIVFIEQIDTFKKCRKIYLGHNVLLTGEQDALIRQRNIAVNIIPNYYYQELED